MTKVADIAAFMDRFAPTESAAEWDNVGLLLGELADPAERIMTCLTITPDVVEEAVRERANLIVSHHPILFRGAKTSYERNQRWPRGASARPRRGRRLFAAYRLR